MATGGVYPVNALWLQTVDGTLGKCVEQLPSWRRQTLNLCFVLPTVTLL